jgi:hypothetical protein
VSLFLQRLSYSSGNIIKHFVPAHSFPSSITPLSLSLQWVQDPVGICDLINSSRAFRAVSASATGVMGVSFEFTDLKGVFINVGS